MILPYVKTTPKQKIQLFVDNISSSYSKMISK